jgi:hypothetical protein
MIGGRETSASFEADPRFDPTDHCRHKNRTGGDLEVAPVPMPPLAGGGAGEALVPRVGAKASRPSFSAAILFGKRCDLLKPTSKYVWSRSFISINGEKPQSSVEPRLFSPVCSLTVATLPDPRDLRQ